MRRFENLEIWKWLKLNKVGRSSCPPLCVGMSSGLAKGERVGGCFLEKSV